MITMGKKYRTRDGRPVELLTTSGRGKWPVMGYIGDSDHPSRWDIDGMNILCNSTKVLDLVEVKPKRILWLNVYPDDEVHAHESREDADGSSGDNRIARLKIEFEEGQFDE